MPRRNRKPGSALGRLTTLPFVAAAGWIAYSNLLIDHAVAPRKAIDAEWRTFLGERSGVLTYYVDRHASGRPLVLLHSINAAGSSYEMGPLFLHYMQHRPVYALDLPGFGFSERSPRVYSPRLYADAILDFLESQVDESADVVALSLSCEFAAQAALDAPERFHSLTLISPTGFTSRELPDGSQQAGTDQAGGALYRLFSFPLWAQAFYDLIVTRASLHYFLSRSFEGEVYPGLEQYAYVTSHQPGARFAPVYFVSGKLFTPDVRAQVYDQLALPVLVLYDRDAFVRFDLLPETLARHSNWRGHRIIPTQGLPQFEQPEATAQALDHFWEEQ